MKPFFTPDIFNNFGLCKEQMDAVVFSANAKASILLKALKAISLVPCSCKGDPDFLPCVACFAKDTLKENS